MAVVIGGSRGLGRGMASALAVQGRPVVSVARTPSGPAPGLTSVVADARDPAVVAELLDEHDPDLVVVVAGAVPHVGPLHHQTWETFSRHWDTDVRIAFNVLREALLRPLHHGAKVVVVSSGAAFAGSPLSGGYAGAKATQRLMVRYAQEEADRNALDLRFCALYPQLTPLTAVGRHAARAYADRAAVTEADFVENLGTLLTPKAAGSALVDLLSREATSWEEGYRLTATGLSPVPG